MLMPTANSATCSFHKGVHHVGTYRDATCAAVADIVTTSDGSDCVRAVTNYVMSRGYDPYVGKNIALHNC
jgi:hypothetical protein